MSLKEENYEVRKETRRLYKFVEEYEETKVFRLREFDEIKSMIINIDNERSSLDTYVNKFQDFENQLDRQRKINHQKTKEIRDLKKQLIDA